VLAGVLLFGVVLGLQESVYRAAVASMAPEEARGLAYGVFNTVYGVGFVVGGAAYGFFLERGAAAAGILYTVAAQAAALAALVRAAEEAF
ncbi:MAG: MFS transporter, partial [Candidatus Korarchaeota archaeon]|nr:MFS transporter [Candidatus Korarchaeota archaeon]